jgi:2-(1,2-epoxy-1,2-dihydrophenyl)acetyl-CoA isomerase
MLSVPRPGETAVLPSGHVRVERGEHHAVVTLERPERLNALDDAMFDELHTVFSVLANEPARALVLTGAGRGFCAGGDLTRRSEGATLPALADSTAELRHRAELGELLATMPSVTVAAVNGACAGAGLAIAACCDLRIVSRSAVFTPAYLTAGLPGDLGGLRAVARLIGRARAASWWLLPEKLDAANAAEWGLATEVVDPGELAARVDAVVARLVRSAPLALRAIKENVRDLDEPDYLDREARRHAALRSSADAAEAARAFVEKRSPVFVAQ